MSKTGRDQARRLAEHLADVPFTRLVSSPFLRCIQTLEPFADVRGLDVTIARELSESEPPSGAEAWVLATARLFLTVLEFTAVTFLLHQRDAGPTLTRRALLASACLVVVEVGLRLAPTNLDPTFKWWVVSAYWAYVPLRMTCHGITGAVVPAPLALWTSAPSR
jgi:hypothetical protein